LIQDDIDKVGVFHRVFYRVKTASSTTKKISQKKYDGINTHLRDIIGIRVVFYFADDLDFMYRFFRKKYDKLFVEESIDKKSTTVFEPQRVNVIFRIPSENQTEFRDLITEDKIDSTFELQLRTVFSEGWHEIDHDLRYKFKEHWLEHDDLSRMFNGIFASLETTDWSIISLFNQLSYKHYKAQSIDAMIRTKYRLRLKGDSSLSSKLVDFFIENRLIIKELYKMDRAEFLYNMACEDIRFPLTIDNVIYYINYKYIKNEELTALTPKELLNQFSE
jgi:ppGpp synthetase/RelA/SpoT-type nucleotidyltranferase